jgi:tripartite-type tricarboxylate transporter receptor subunit TctC
MGTRKNCRKISAIVLEWPFCFCLSAFPDYPDKPITIYCGYGPGASTDVTSRSLATGLEKMWGSVVVENKPGGEPRYAPGWWRARSPTIPWA